MTKQEDQVDVEKDDVDQVEIEGKVPEPSDTPEPIETKEAPAPEPTIAELKQQVADLTRLVEATADKGRLLQYESTKQGKKPLRVHLSKYMGGYIIGWRTIKDELIKHPTTGRVVGENQEYEVQILLPDSTVNTKTVIGYPAFSDARYTDRVQVEVASKKEDWNGQITFSLKLPDGRDYDLPGQFAN